MNNMQDLIREEVMGAMGEETEKIRRYMRDAIKYRVYAVMEEIDLEEMVADMIAEMVSESEVREAVEELVAAMIDEEI